MNSDVKSAKENMGNPCIDCRYEFDNADVFPCKECIHNNGDKEMFNFSVEKCYRDNIIALMDKQAKKGMDKYGQTLEENNTLSTEQRIEHLQEELIDAMQYCEHLKRCLTDTLTANDYQRMAMRTAGTKKEDFLDNAIMGLCGEVGECADIVKKHHFQGHELDREKLIDEASDVCWYIALLATALDTTLEDIMLHNVEKLKKRYPQGFSKERSIHRNENETERSLLERSE